MTINKDKRIYKPFSRLCVKILPTRLLTQAQDFFKKFQRREKQEIKNQDESGYTFSGRWLRHNCIESTVRVIQFVSCIMATILWRKIFKSIFVFGPY